MRVHYLKHVPFEGLGAIDTWLIKKRLKASVTNLFQNESLPSIDEIDWLIVMGGPMSANDGAKYPWISSEKKLIGQALDRQIPILGICLGCQLIASVLGSKVYKNSESEIGWFPIEPVQSIRNQFPGSLLPSKTEVFHWHGETFDLPTKTVHLARSQACENQAFLYGDRVLGLQFHLETTLEALKALIYGCADELQGGTYIQKPNQMLANLDRFEQINKVLENILNYLSTKVS